MIFKELEKPLPLLTPKGTALCHFIIDYGMEHHLYFVCFQDETGECWTWPNPKIRIQNNITVGRIKSNQNDIKDNYE